jgi:hypothetical protein
MTSFSLDRSLAAIRIELVRIIAFNVPLFYSPFLVGPLWRIMLTVKLPYAIAVSCPECGMSWLIIIVVGGIKWMRILMYMYSLFIAKGQFTCSSSTNCKLIPKRVGRSTCPLHCSSSCFLRISFHWHACYLYCQDCNTDDEQEDYL